MKTGLEIRNEVRAIVVSRPENLSAEIASYVMRVRNETLRPGRYDTRLAAHEIENLPDGHIDRTFPIL